MERNATVGEREKGVVLANADIATGIEFRAALTHQNVARSHFLTTEFLHAKTTTGRITTVAR